MKKQNLALGMRF